MFFFIHFISLHCTVLRKKGRNLEKLDKMLWVTWSSSYCKLEEFLIKPWYPNFWKLLDPPIYPLDTELKLNLHKTFRRCLECLLNVLCKFNLRSASQNVKLLATWKMRLKLKILSKPLNVVYMQRQKLDTLVIHGKLTATISHR